MKTRITFFAMSLLALSSSWFASCSYGEFDALSAERASTPSANQGDQSQAGLITAGEWNDLENWAFWEGLLTDSAFTSFPDKWIFFPNHRISVRVEAASGPMIDAEVELKKGSALIWAARTDNTGKAELWIGMNEKQSTVDLDAYQLWVNGTEISASVKSFESGVNEIFLNSGQAISNQVDLAFIVDATGSMGDELEFLKEDLEDVITRVLDDYPQLDIRTSSVFYRDKGDKYVTRESDFTENLGKTIKFIQKQEAGGGGDFPEAVHSALDEGINKLDWSSKARTRIAFLLLDAPPHHEDKVIQDLQISIKSAAAQGIKVIPITASGIDKETEFLMRFFSIATNGTYVFITNDSGIGNNHIEATVGDYEVEFLNDLLVRLIEEYAD